MIVTKEAKLISDLIRRKGASIRPILYEAFETSILDAMSEVNFFHRLISELANRLPNLSSFGLNVHCRHQVIHKKPIVRTKYGDCELGDLLVVVKYRLSSGSIEAKSIIYQVKLSKRIGSMACTIDPKQLRLLCDWPAFSFGKTSTGLLQFSIKPNSLEFGSYMLEPRKPERGNYLPNRYRCYGICPYAELVRQFGSNNVPIYSMPHTRGDANNFFGHVSFEIGEYHGNQTVKDLVEALYRFVGLSPDPPDEFDGFWKIEKDDAFAIIEINIALSRDSGLFKFLNELEK